MYINIYICVWDVLQKKNTIGILRSLVLSDLEPFEL